MNAPSRFAGLSRGAARAALALLMLAMLVSLDALRLGVAGDAAPQGPGDLALYGGIAEAVRHGGDYYGAAADALRANGYPLKPFVAFRLPTLAVVVGALPAWAATALLYALAGAVFMAWWPRIAGAFAKPVARAAGGLLLATGMVAHLQPALAHFHEIWAGLFVALSLGLWSRGRWAEAAAFGLAACVVRETAALYVAVMLGFAILSGAKREAMGWAVVLAVLAGVVAVHAYAVAPLLRPLDPVSPGWLGLPGPGAWVRGVAASTALSPLPLWVAGPIVALAMFGWTAWRSPVAARVAATLGAYALLLSVAGRPDTFYWALLPAVPLLLGLAFAPAGLRDLLKAASARKRRITVTRVAR